MSVLPKVLATLGAVLLTFSALPQAPMTVTPDGTLTLHGKPYRAIGVNAIDVFWRVLASPADTSYEDTFKTLARRDIPFARVAFCPFWPKDYDLYQQDPAEYFRRMDGVVRAAEQNNIGLVVSLHWAHYAVPDRVSEPVSAWGRADSKTIAFMREYTRTIVSRYEKSPAIWIWELGNEFSLAADVDPLPPVVPTLGTPDHRTDADRVSTADMQVAWSEFGRAVRALDSIRPITTGNSLPRPPSEQLRLTRTWSPLDTHEQLIANLQTVTPDPLNLISVHIYPDDITTARFAADHHATYQELASLCMSAAATARKPLLIGEFGALGADDDARKQVSDMIAAFLESKVPLAAVWNFDWRLGDAPGDWNITESNSRSFILDAIERANETITASR